MRLRFPHPIRIDRRGAAMRRVEVGLGRGRRWIYHRLMAVYGPVTLRLVRRPRTSRWRGLRLDVPAGVFHPGLFHSSRALAAELTGGSVALAGRTLLDVGCGSGLLALAAARAGARVTALDLNPAAVAATEANAARHGLDIVTVTSDLFASLDQGERFDVVAVNPPYFRHDPATLADHAWHAGAGFEYFDRFFAGLADHIHERSTVLMVLGELCDVAAVRAAAAQHGFTLQLRRRRFSWTLGASDIFAINRHDPPIGPTQPGGPRGDTSGPGRRC